MRADELYWQTQSGWGSRVSSCRGALTPETFDILEQAARHYNRTHAAAAIASGTDEQDPSRLGA